MSSCVRVYYDSVGLLCVPVTKSFIAMTTNSLDKVHSFADAKALMAAELKNFCGRENCYKEPLVNRIEIPIQGLDQLSWLSQQSTKTKIYGSHQSGLYAIAGVGEALCVSGEAVESHAKIFQRMRLYLRPEFKRLQFYGGFCFDAQHPGREWASFSGYKFVIPQFEVAAKDGKMIFCCNIILHGGATPSMDAVLNELERLRYNGKGLDDVAVRLDSRRDEPTQDAWRRNVQTVLNEIRSKNCEKVVLARRTRFDFNKPLDPWLIAQQLKNVTPNSYHFCFQFDGERLFLGASPERLFARQNNAIESEALAGTRPRGKNGSDDNRLKGELKSSGKEQHEHKVVVTMINNKLMPLCQNLTVHQQEILSVANGHHLRTRIQGLLNDGVQDEEILAVLHPTPAVGGAPTETALGLIEELEVFSRGWYAGAVGHVGLDQTEFVVAIRSAMVHDRHMTVYAGAGIVEGSTAKNEWQEIEHKIGNFLRVLNAKN